MAYWWVNHKKTFQQEISGGYIWSPKKKANGARNETYNNLTKTKPGDIVLSYAGALIKAIGVVDGACREQPKPEDFGTAGDAWSNLGWAVPIQWELLEVPFHPKAHIEEIKSLLPEKYSPIQKNGNGNESCYLAAISNELGEEILRRVTTPENLDALALIDADKGAIEEIEQERIIFDSEMETTEKEQLVKSRTGQGRFRQNLEKVESKCRVTGVAQKNLLIGSHIKPWRLSDNKERIDGNNGLLLSPHIDKLFDQGWISFSDNGELMVANGDLRGVLSAWGVNLDAQVGKFNPQQCIYLAFHREKIFKNK